MKLNNLIKQEQRYLKRITIMTIAGLVLVVGIMVGPSIGNWTEDIVVVTGVVYGADYRPQSKAQHTRQSSGLCWIRKEGSFVLLFRLAAISESEIAWSYISRG